MRRCSRMCGWHTATRSGSSRASGILLGSRRRSAVQGLRCIALRRNRLCGARSVTRSMGSLQLEQDEAHRAGATRQIVRPSPALPTDSPEEVDRILREASRSVDDEARKQYADVRAARQEIDRFLRDENTRLAAEAKLAGSKFSPRTIRDLDPDDVSELTGIPRRIVNEAIQDSQIVHKSVVPDMAPGSGAREDRARERVRRAIDEINRRGVEQRGNSYRPFSTEDISGDLRMVIDLPSARDNNIPARFQVCDSCTGVLDVYQKIFPNVRVDAVNLRMERIYPL